jgi:CHAT domain-containing protein
MIQKAGQAESGPALECYVQLTRLYALQRRFREEETLHGTTVTLAEKLFGKQDYRLVPPLWDFAMFYVGQNRPNEAKPLFERVLKLREQADANRPEVALTLYWLAAVELGREGGGSIELAEERLRRATEILKATGDARAESELLLGLAILHGRKFIDLDAAKMDPEKIKRGDYSEAKNAAAFLALIEQSLAAAERAYGADRPEILLALNMSAHMKLQLKDVAGAQPQVSRGLKIAEAHRDSPSHHHHYPSFRQLHAQMLWLKGQQTEALGIMEQVVESVERQLEDGAGTDEDRARYIAMFRQEYGVLLGWYGELGRVADALRAEERMRTRTLLDQMNQSGGILNTLPPADADRLLRRQRDAHTRLQQVLKELSLPGVAGTARERALRSDEQAIQRELVSIFREVGNRSSAVQLSQRREQRAADAAAIQAWCRDQQALVLEYTMVNDAAFVFVIPPDGPLRLEPLTVSEQDAKTLKILQGPLLLPVLSSVLGTETSRGLRQRLGSRAAAESAVRELASLWRVLIPEPERKRLVSGALKQLVLMPYGPLGALPFETLVVSDDRDPEYLLDVGPPITYAPSTTVLLNLVAREASPPARGVAPVLTIGDPKYPAEPSRANVAFTDLSPRVVYRTAGVPLARLPYTEWESKWIQQVFGRTSIPVKSLFREQATEAEVRTQVVGRRIVHVACHGFVDRSFGNLFGALAVTPGSNAATEPSDDGFLSLPEVYALNLKGCELAILSACDTNSGPQIGGEGTWALSRGFLIAGARRVAATNWLVDDEATASLVSIFCTALAKDMAKSVPIPYAQRLHEAKQWVRKQPKWASPYYWGAFELIGAP